MNELERLLYLRGVAADYIDYSGNSVRIPQEDRLDVLRAMGIDTDNPKAVNQAIEDIDVKPWRTWLQPLQLVQAPPGSSVELRVSPDELEVSFAWNITGENGELHSGTFRPELLPESGNYVADRVRYSARRLELPELEVGYYRFELRASGRRRYCQIAVVPGRCYQPEWVANGEGVWGLNVQLYALRADTDWGIGDFSTLRDLIVHLARVGADFILLNPLHALDASNIGSASPYSPSDRRWINPVYISPEAIPEYHACAEVASLVAEMAGTLESLRAKRLIDYGGVVTLKYRLFSLLYRHFVDFELNPRSERGGQFLAFVERFGAELREFASHTALNAPTDLGTNFDERFFMFLQWLADSQLASCQKLAREQGMRLGVVRDLAVSVIPDGAEVAANATIFCPRANVGAPPDAWAPQGQDWGILPTDPESLRATGFEHIIKLLRANMRHCGALRLDHVMSVLRLWWQPHQSANGHGAYVYYPVDELLGLLRLESVRSQCMIIGEDLGIVPPELRPKLWESGIFSSALFYFEKLYGTFRRPEAYSDRVLLTIANHDVPTLAAWWSGEDLRLRRTLGLIESERMLSEALDERGRDKALLLDWLSQLELLPEQWKHRDTRAEFDQTLCGAIFESCSRSRALMLSIQPEDLYFETSPVNIPGTNKEYPNWRRRLSADAYTLLETEPGRKLVGALNKYRGHRTRSV